MIVKVCPRDVHRRAVLKAPMQITILSTKNGG